MSKFKDLITKELSYISEVAPSESQVGAQVGQPNIPVTQSTSKPPVGPANMPTIQQIAQDIYKNAGSAFPDLLKALTELSKKPAITPQPAGTATSQPVPQQKA